MGSIQFIDTEPTRNVHIRAMFQQDLNDLSRYVHLSRPLGGLYGNSHWWRWASPLCQKLHDEIRVAVS